MTIFSRRSPLIVPVLIPILLGKKLKESGEGRSRDNEVLQVQVVVVGNDNRHRVHPSIEAEQGRSAVPSNEQQCRDKLLERIWVGRNFLCRPYLDAVPPDISVKREAVAAIDEAIDSLYEHSDFRSAGRDLFLTAIEGKLTPDKEDMIHELGIRI